jgi:hypothetical protein
MDFVTRQAWAHGARGLRRQVDSEKRGAAAAMAPLSRSVDRRGVSERKKPWRMSKWWSPLQNFNRNQTLGVWLLSMLLKISSTLVDQVNAEQYDNWYTEYMRP